MKLTRTSKRASGMTLLELTVVILVLLSLISILFVGARAWKKGSDRSANIMNIRNVQQAVRAHQNMNGLSEGNPLEDTIIFGNGTTEGYLKEPIPPSTDIAGAYTYLGTVPAIGILYITNATGNADYAPATTTYADW
ncbi:hypothetical protein [Luteolibacter luteus]|uniref:Prepilin-type N-terminal cleavage/methylation domain-containing protein n=1 Tax=Luteolibacter luteus TaxID=2728835 RepID=A0A858RP92_9BACT|nr:hypothetical protein [Luteolibacter luteus]QJE95554.1 hypothetical protein HHL09_07065 [Luteolibacter luteus]QJE98837.1 hypothetical protein HHL09_24670 [Luteolibacter luteus]